MTDRKAASALALLVIAFVVLTWAQDLLRSNINISAFYFTESLMFSTYWLLFAPLLFAQYFAVKYKHKKSVLFQIAIIILPVFIHLFAFPFIVWVLSTIFITTAFPLNKHSIILYLNMYIPCY